MSGYFIEETIARPPETVFAYCADLVNAASALEEVVEAQWVSPGPALGARFRETRRTDGNLSTTELEMVEYQPPARYAVMADVSNIRVTYAYDFVPDGNGTRVSLECHVEGRGLKRALAPLVAKVLRSKDGDQLKRIRLALEAE